jgi:hypothetical protein
MPNFREVHDYIAEKVASKTGRSLDAIIVK